MPSVLTQLADKLDKALQAAGRHEPLAVMVQVIILRACSRI